MPKLKVLLLLHSLSLNGAPKIALEALGSSPANVEVLTVAMTGGPREEACRRLGDLISLNGMFLGGLPLLSRLRRRLRLQRIIGRIKAFAPDVVYVNSVASLPLVRVLGFLKDTTTPVALHVHELRSYQLQYLRSENQAFTQRPSQYIAVSDAVRDALKNDCGIKGSRINVIPAFVPAMANWPDNAPQKSSTDKPFVVGGAGFPVWIKGSSLWVQIVAETVRLLGTDSVRFKYVGIGEEENSWQMQEMARKLGVANRIEWVKTTPDSLTHFQDFDCFVSASWEDPCPITVLENMRIGNPVLCFEGSGGAPFEVGDTGVVVPNFSPREMAEQIAALARDPERRLRLGEAAKQRIKDHFTDVVHGPRIVEVLRRAAAANPAVHIEAASVSNQLGGKMNSVENYEPVPIRAIALHLPQYHPIAENDAWWGKGFTEWTNVARAQPLFPGHYQPHIPADLGYYDLRLPETRLAQAELARRYGLHGFCYYHYWFNGRRLLEQPVNAILSSREPDFPFCLCWANENWTRAWDGLDREVLVKQDYSEQDDRAHMRYLAENVFPDPRYIRVDGKPVFIIYRSLRLPDVRRTTEVWRDEARRCGIEDLYLCRFESFPEEHYDPADDGFDAAIEFQPDWAAMPPMLKQGRYWRWMTRLGLSEPIFQHSRVWEYAAVVEAMLRKPAAPYKRYPGVTPAWDNTARKKTNIGCIQGSTPELYGHWLTQTLKKFVPPSPQENFVFVNAWNEWAEGNHLEPDQKWGHAYLEATARALSNRTGERHAPESAILAPTVSGGRVPTEV